MDSAGQVVYMTFSHASYGDVNQLAANPVSFFHYERERLGFFTKGKVSLQVRGGDILRQTPEIPGSMQDENVSENDSEKDIIWT